MTSRISETFKKSHPFEDAKRIQTGRGGSCPRPTSWSQVWLLHSSSSVVAMVLPPKVRKTSMFSIAVTRPTRETKNKFREFVNSARKSNTNGMSVICWEDLYIWKKSWGKKQVGLWNVWNSHLLNQEICSYRRMGCVFDVVILQGGPLVINGVMEPLYGWKWMSSWGYFHPYKWSYLGLK